MKHGVGIYEMEEKDLKYVGEFVYDKMHGKGEYTQNGNTYRGNWIENRMQGKFSISYADGAEFWGNYQDDEKNGDFELSKDGVKWIGKYVNGKIEG